MAKSKTDKRKAKRKIKLRERRQKQGREIQREKAEYFFSNAIWHWDSNNPDKALHYMEKSVRLDPKNEEYLTEMAHLGYEIKRPDVELKALNRLYDNGLISPESMPNLCGLLSKDGRYERALSIIQETLPLIPAMTVRNKKSLTASLIQNQKYCQFRLESSRNLAADRQKKSALRQSPKSKTPGDIGAAPQRITAPPEKPAQGERVEDRNPLPEIPVAIHVDAEGFRNAFSGNHFASREDYGLALEGHRIRFRDTFENLICLNSIKDIKSFWYQEETAKKVLRGLRGRALLSDEVGLGKTIEALIILKEYIQRGMVKSALILTPTPLVSQWKDEMKVKFGLDFPSTNDPDYRANGLSFWQEPFILSSINIAKSKRNFPAVTEREYDIVIVDEAHHLKNRNTINWKLVNALKKRFLLFLTATPVENNLMEIYNLVTLLKPGQLKTASDFRDKFMTRGDPTAPQNRSLLKGLLGQVMIRNTRALARVDIPPRFAETIRVDPYKLELEFYERISLLAKDINSQNGGSNRLLTRNLLEEAGSSSRAVSLTLSRILKKEGLPLWHENEIRAINNMCQSLQESSKNKFMLELIKNSPDKIIIFVKYIGTIEHVSEFLSRHGISYSLFHGRMDNRIKEEQINKFREDNDVLVTTEIGGEGRNLQFCHKMINYDLTWNPMKIEQRIGRIHRIGQEKEVMIYNLCAHKSVEDYILQILDKKINMFEMVIGEIDMILGRIKGEQDFSGIVYDIWMNSESEKDREKAFGQLGTRLMRAKTNYKKTKELDGKLFGVDYEL